MEWQVVVLCCAVLATCCFYKWCNTNFRVSVNQREIMKQNAELSENADRTNTAE